ncbi:MAG: nucleotidyl transferase AbiEii/AbiGii toxin family protein [Chloroflexi bacterium]|nr:nucleotidyl transferase AbiEii/AbiGii toxin family protein [Chloroflexota bacterium]
MNLPASVHQRLLNLSQQRGEEFNLLLTRFAIERLLYRLSRSEESGRFVLKGALAFAVWGMQPHRPTRDLDLLGCGDNTSGRWVEVFRRICASDSEADGLTFDLDSVRAQPIRLDQEYQGQRIELNAFLGKARIPLQIDIGFGDIVTPPAEEAVYPTLLSFPAPRVRVYPKETVVAEKLHAMVVLGALNSRIKDFYDLWMLAQELSFDGPILGRAIAATFARRQTALPASRPVALTAEFAQRPDVQARWEAFLRRNRLVVGGRTFLAVLTDLSDFLMPILTTLVGDAAFDLTWPPRGLWRHMK